MLKVCTSEMTFCLKPGSIQILLIQLCVCVCGCLYASARVCISGVHNQRSISQGCRKGSLIPGIIACLLFSLWASNADWGQWVGLSPRGPGTVETSKLLVTTGSGIQLNTHTCTQRRAYIRVLQRKNISCKLSLLVKIISIQTYLYIKSDVCMHIYIYIYISCI